jgi:tetratricopeptide (TPR) repeat protein
MPILRHTVFTLALASLLALPVVAQTPPPARAYELATETSEALAKYKTETDANNNDAALAIIEAQLAKVGADSYDSALLLRIKAFTLMQKTEYSKALEFMEKGFLLSQSKTPTFYDETANATIVGFLAQLYFQEAVQSKNPTIAAGLFDKASKYADLWHDTLKKPTYENQLFFSRFYYSKGMQNPDKPNEELLKRSLLETDEGLRLSTRPKDELYLMKFVCLSQLNRYAEAAEVLELLVKNKPESATYWQQLASLYLNTEQTVRAVLTFERAQANGHMNAPKDNYNLVGILYNIGQYTKAAELLESGLRDGKIEQALENWELLALCYQNMDRPLKGIEALKEATKHFPKSGQVDFMIAQAYQSLDQPANALAFAQTAIAKGNFTKSKIHQVYFFTAYMAYELKKYELALEYAKKTAEFPEGARDGNNMTKAVEDILREREAKKNKS